MAEENPQPEVEAEPDPTRAKLLLEVEALEARIAAGGYRTPAELMELEFAVAARRAAVDLHDRTVAGG